MKLLEGELWLLLTESEACPLFNLNPSQKNMHAEVAALISTQDLSDICRQRPVLLLFDTAMWKTRPACKKKPKTQQLHLGALQILAISHFHDLIQVVWLFPTHTSDKMPN